MSVPQLHAAPFQRKTNPSTDIVSVVMRSLLVLCGMPTANDLVYTPHSWRHLHLTLGRQLQLSDDQLNVSDGAERSGMPRRYGMAACVSELAAKSKYHGCVNPGWKPVAPGRVPDGESGVASRDRSFLGGGSVWRAGVFRVRTLMQRITIHPASTHDCM